MNSIKKRLCNPIVALCVLYGAGTAHADAVTDWNAIMEATVAAPPTNPFFQARWGAIVQLAVFEAVNAVVGDYEPYLGTITAPPGASPDAAAIAAAYRTLVTLRRAAPRPSTPRGPNRWRRSRTARRRMPASPSVRPQRPPCSCSGPTMAGTPSCPTHRGPIPATGSQRPP